MLYQTLSHTLKLAPHEAPLLSPSRRTLNNYAIFYAKPSRKTLNKFGKLSSTLIIQFLFKLDIGNYILYPSKIFIARFGINILGILCILCHFESFCKQNASIQNYTTSNLICSNLVSILVTNLIISEFDFSIYSTSSI